MTTTMMINDNNIVYRIASQYHVPPSTSQADCIQLRHANRLVNLKVRTSIAQPSHMTPLHVP